MLLHLQELRGFLQRPAQQEDEGNDEATDEEWNAPFGNSASTKEAHHSIARNSLTKHEAEDRGDEDCDLLAGRLKRGVEASVARGGNFGQVHGDAAELDAGRKSL